MATLRGLEDRISDQFAIASFRRVNQVRARRGMLKSAEPNQLVSMAADARGLPMSVPPSSFVVPPSVAFWKLLPGRCRDSRLVVWQSRFWAPHYLYARGRSPNGKQAWSHSPVARSGGISDDFAVAGAVKNV